MKNGKALSGGLFRFSLAIAYDCNPKSAARKFRSLPDDVANGIGFAGLGFAAYRKARPTAAIV